jgi:erythromycin esterase
MSRASSAALLAPLCAVILTGCEGATDPPGAADPDPVAWLSQHAIRLSSVSPTSTDFSDLEPLRPVLQGTRVVMLGEQTHGDGTTFLAKSRLIRFLHQEMGFDVLVFESGLYDVWKSWERIEAGEDARTAIRRGVFGVWSLSDQLEALMAYIEAAARTSSPLIVAGMDAQLTGSASRDFLLDDLERWLEAGGSAVVAGGGWPGFRQTLDGLIERIHFVEKPPVEEQEAFLEVMAALRAEAEARPDSDAPFWRQALQSIQAHAVGEWLRPVGGTSVESQNVREQQMGRNLVWLAEEAFPGRRIVVWAATRHIARDLPSISSYPAGYASVGQEVHLHFGDAMYLVGFTAREGAWGYPGGEARPIAPPSPGSLEALMHEAGLENAIVDFRSPASGSEWLRQPLIARPMGYSEMVADWGNVLDGMVYTRVMEPNTATSQ